MSPETPQDDRKISTTEKTFCIGDTKDWRLNHVCLCIITFLVINTAISDLTVRVKREVSARLGFSPCYIVPLPP